MALIRSLAWFAVASVGSFAASAQLHPAIAADDEAIVYVRTLNDAGEAALYFPLSASADNIGNLYVADTNHHRIVKFDKHGNFVRAFGSEGFDPGQLYYPHAVSVGDLPNGGTGVYVADNGNHRVSVFTSGGTFVRTFGTYGGGDGQLNYPAAIATLIGVPGAGVYVADANNNRVVRFSLKGKWLQTFTCADCPNGNLQQPAGIGLRKLDSGDWQIYVSDPYRQQVHVLNSNGQYQRSFGSEGYGDGEIELVDEIAVDSDGSAYTADPAFNNERITRFSPSGQFVSSFKSTGTYSFVQPHGVALDPRGYIYVLDSSSDVFMFQLRAPELEGIPAEDSAYWIDNHQATFDVNYNGVERTCDINGVAKMTVTADDGQHVFTVNGRVEGVGAAAARMTMSLSNQQTRWLDQAEPGQSKVVLNLNGACRGGLLLTERKQFRV